MHVHPFSAEHPRSTIGFSPPKPVFYCVADPCVLPDCHGGEGYAAGGPRTPSNLKLSGIAASKGL